MNKSDKHKNKIQSTAQDLEGGVFTAIELGTICMETAELLNKEWGKDLDEVSKNPHWRSACKQAVESLHYITSLLHSYLRMTRKDPLKTEMVDLDLRFNSARINCNECRKNMKMLQGNCIAATILQNGNVQRVENDNQEHIGGVDDE